MAVTFLTNEDKQELSGNINNKVDINPQTLTEEQKAQARDNIGALDKNLFSVSKTEFTPVNILEGLTLTTTTGALWMSSGVVGSNQYTGEYTAVNEKIDVLAGHTYVIKNFCGCLRLFYQDGTVGDQVTLTADENNKPGVAMDREYTVPDGVVRIGIAYMHKACTIPQIYRLTATSEEDAAELKVTSDDLSLLPSNIDNENVVSLLAPLKGKVIVNFGDSIFGNARPPEDISTRLAELTGATVHNCGFGGCRMAEHVERYDPFSMYRLVDAITTGDFTLQDAALLGGGLPAYFEETTTLLKSIDFTKVDIITIAYGVNDWQGGYNNAGGYILGEPTEPLQTTKFKGAFRYSIETILSQYPHIRIFVCSPCYSAFLDSSNNFVEDTSTKIRCEFTMFDCIGQLKSVAEEYALPFIDNYHIGINKVNRLNYFPVYDGTHHNINGRKLIAEHIAKELF